MKALKEQVGKQEAYKAQCGDNLQWYALSSLRDLVCNIINSVVTCLAFGDLSHPESPFLCV